ncbi:hypothetical protein BKA63DRAFT_106292 [Paraphoma chrysanthemicola]|nr:hypothetical protein BKA63DRAFT_106292 [Paraphoma chrysanthemicola]
MGNNGNLKCDRKTYAPKEIASPESNGPSRIERDLSSSPHQDHYMEDANSVDSPMIRRAAGTVPHVCIVGAGVAGLRCAAVLLKHAAKVTILEGRDRVGGRLFQSDALGHLVDLGPNWIHGTDHNPILDLAKETNTQTMNWDGRASVFDHLGKGIPPEDVLENDETVWSIIEQAMKYSNEDSASIPAERSLFNYFEEQVQKIFPDEEDIANQKLKKKRETILQMAEMWGAFVGSPVQTQSLKFFWLEECIDGENLFVAETYHKILQKIAEPALKAKIKFGHKVTKVISKESEAIPRVTIEIEGEESETFDEVIVTAPLGWLKRNMKAFEPEVPVRLKQGIEAIGYGHLDKVYINFPTAFWNESGPPPSTAPPSSANTSIPNVTATTAPVHQHPSDSAVNPAHYPGFTHWLSPTYAPDTNPHKWQQEAVNLAALPGPAAHPTLLFYIFGPTSLHIASLLTNNPASKHQALLTEFFQPYFSRLPNYSAADPAHQPKHILATNWASDELAGFGSYSNFQTGLDRGSEDIEVMRRGMPERGVWLAGEHTAPFVALGTVTGAWWAGEGVARRILRAYGLGGDGVREKEGNED